jgi:lysozyme
MTILSRWTSRAATRRALLKAARARLAAAERGLAWAKKYHRPSIRERTAQVVALRKVVKVRAAQVAYAERIVKRHSRPTSTSEAGVRFIMECEGFSAVRYDDGVGVQTIGFGTTNADVHPLPARITREGAEALLRRALATKYEPAVEALGLTLTQGQYDALVSFAYNLGPAAFTTAPNFQTLQRAVRAKDVAAIARCLPLYSDPGTPSVHAGLLARRKAEQAMMRA